MKSKRVTDSAGTVISTIELDPRGGDTARSNNAAFQPRRFTTYDRDGNASDEAMHRRYNRWHSRFDQPDPYGGSYDITDPQSFNRYSYVQNDPVNFVDPRGLCPEGTTLHTDPETGRTECVPGPSASVEIRPGSDPFWDSFSASAGRPLILDVSLIPAPLMPLLPVPQKQTPTATPAPQKTTAAKKANADCFARHKREIDAAREKFRNDFGKRLAFSAAVGGLRGAVAGGIAGNVGGGALFGVGAVPGAILGSTIGGILGAAGGVITGAFFIEPARRVLYNTFDYEGAEFLSKVVDDDFRQRPCERPLVVRPSR